MDVTVLTLDADEKPARPLRWIERVIFERYSYKQMYNIYNLIKN